MLKIRSVALAALVALALPPFAHAQDVFHGCSMEGSSKIKSVRALNRDKNRYTAPTASEIDQTITLKAMLKRGNDRNRWSNSQAGEITGYVAAVLSGGKETAATAR